MSLLPAGKYRARPVAAALGVTGTGKEQIAVTFELVDPAGEKMTWYGFFSEKTMDRTIQSLRHCGWKGNDLAVFVEVEGLPEGFDQEVELDVQHEEYPANSGNIRARVAWVNAGGGLALKNAASRDQAKTFAERMKRQIDALDKAAGRAAAPATPQPPKPAPRRAVPATETPLEVLEGQAPGEDLPF